MTSYQGWPRTIDVSRWQGNINWALVAQSGVSGAWVKVGGADGSLYRDPKAAQNTAGAKAVGFPYGTYYFASPAVGSARRQARHAIDCGHGQGRLWPALDLERHNGMTGPELDDWALEWCDEVRRQTGRETLIYTGAWIGQNGSFFGYHRPALASCPLWLANYGRNAPGFDPTSSGPTVPGVWKTAGWSMWQINDKTRLPGIAENTVDINIATPAFWASQLGDVHTHPAPKPATPKEEWMMKSIRKNGDLAQWRLVDDGNGVLRRQPVPSLAHRGVLAKAGLVQGDEVVLTDPAEIAAFDAIPTANERPADIGAFHLAVLGVAETRAAAERVIAATAGRDPMACPAADAIADMVADEMAVRLSQNGPGQ